MTTKSAPSSPTYLRKRRFYLVLPILVLPFLTLLFWLLGGGVGSNATAQPVAIGGGLNTALPAAKLKDDSRLTKLDYYRKADADSARRQEQIKNDPYYRLPGLAANSYDTNSAILLNHTLPMKTSGLLSTDPNEAKVYQKLAALDEQLNKRTTGFGNHSKDTGVASSPAVSTDITRAEAILQQLHSRDTSTDPEMQQLSGMLDKILQIQQPVQGTNKAEKAIDAPANPIYDVEQPLAHPVSLLGDSREEQPLLPNAFYGLQDDSLPSTGTRAMSASIAEEQTLVNGATVKLQLLQPLQVNGVAIPAYQFLYGICQLSGERLSITISSLRCRDQLLPVSLSVYDLDGLPGIAIPGALTREVAKQSADQSISSLGLSSLNPSIGAQAAGAGIQAAKSLLSKKVRLVKVTLPAGYQILLKDNYQKTY